MFLLQAMEAAPEGLEEMIQMAIAAAKGGEWSIFVSLVIMVLVYLVTRTKMFSFIKGEAKAWVAAVAGVLGGVAAAYLTTGEWVPAIMNGLVTGAAASGLWTMLGKKILPKGE